MSEHQITPMRPYLFKAFYEWCVDNQLNPYINVQTNYPGLRIPEQFFDQPKLALCIRPDAVVNWFMDDVGISFTTRFNKVPHQVFIPFGALTEIYSKVIGTILPFAPEPCYVDEFVRGHAPALPGSKATDPVKPATPLVRGKPHLTLVK